MSIFRNHIESMARCYVDLGFDDSDPAPAPAPDPDIGNAAKQNAETAAASFALSREAYNKNLERQKRLDKLTAKVVNRQINISKKNERRADLQWKHFKNVFEPVENRTVRDSLKIDSAGELARASGEAATGVQAQFDNAAGQRRRAQMAMGVNPNSGRALAMENENQLALAATKAGAATSARLTARDRGIALRAGVANFGRNMPNTAANAYGLAVTSGNSAVGNQGAAMTAANNNTNTMNQGFGMAIQGNNSAGGILNQQYGTNVDAWGQQQQANAQSSAGWGQLAGTLGSAAITAYSSKQVKHGKESIDHADTLKKVKQTPVESWEYDHGVADGGRHVGPYAEDVQKHFGDSVAPRGKVIDVVSMMGVTLSAVKGLAKQVDKLEEKVVRVVCHRGLSRNSEREARA